MVVAHSVGETLGKIYKICRKRCVEDQRRDPSKEYCTDGNGRKIQAVMEQRDENC